MKSCRIALLLVVVLAGASRTYATSLSFALNCSFSGPEATGLCAPGGSFGTVTLSDNNNPNWIDLLVDLSLPATPAFHLTGLYLNVNQAFIPDDLKINSVEYQWLGDVNISKIEFKPNDTGPTNTPNGGGGSVAYKYLDIGIEPQNAPDPWSGILKLERKDHTGFFDLNPSMFNLVTNDPGASNAPVFLGVRYQLDTQPSFTWLAVGSLGQTTTDVSPVPEPGALVMIGSGLVAAARRFRRRKNSVS